MITKPIKSIKDIKKFKKYYLERGEYRNYLLVSVCLNTAMRISDVLSLRWEDIYDFRHKRLKTHIILTEKKTGKHTEIFINTTLRQDVALYIEKSGNAPKKGYIFPSRGGKPLSRIQAYRIIKRGGEAVGLDISCHSLRKTFGYQAWKRNYSPVLLMRIYNHSSFEVTKRYLGIEQEEKDSVFAAIAL